MKKILVISVLLMTANLLPAQQTATLKITGIHVDYNGKEYSIDDELEVNLNDHTPSSVIVFNQDGVKYGMEFQYKKGRNRIKLVRWGWATKDGLGMKRGKKRKDMQELKTSITGSFTKRVVDNIILDRDNLEAINISFNYELIYK